MTAAAAGIVEMYETLQMSPEQIAADQELDILAVKMCLAANSVIYREQMEAVSSPTAKTLARIAEGPNPGPAVINSDANEELFNHDDMKSAAMTVAQLMQYGENENVKLRAAKFIIDEKKGRNDVKNLGKLNINVLMINEAIQRARQAKQVARNKVIDISPGDQVFRDSADVAAANT